MFQINRDKLLETISTPVSNSSRDVTPRQENCDKDLSGRVSGRNQYSLFYQKPSSPVTCLAKTRKIQVIQSIECNHDQYNQHVSDTETETSPKHGGSRIQISSNRDITASTSKNMEKPLGNNYQLMFRNKIRVLEIPDNNHNQGDIQTKISLEENKTNSDNYDRKSNENSGKFNSSIPISRYNNKLTKKPPNGSNENCSPYSNSRSKFNKFGFPSDFSRDHHQRESFASTRNRHEMRDTSFQNKFKRDAESPQLNEFSNADEMYRVSKFPPSYNLTQMTTSVAVEFFAR